MSLDTKILKFLASLKLAVMVIIGLAIISAVGTIKEAQTQDAETAQQLVYHSWWMYAVLGTLCVNLIAVMVDRWPWKQHHTGFVLAHIGILILLYGSWITAKYGVDGTMEFAIGEENKVVMVKERELNIFATYGEGMQNIHSEPANFLVNPPSEAKPHVVQLGQDQLRVVEYQHFAFREAEVGASDSPGDGPAVRFQLENPNVNMTEWLRMERGRTDNELDLGPAKVTLTTAAPAPTGRNEIYLVPNKDKKTLAYTIFNKDKSLKKKGTIAQSQTIDTGWMGLQFRVLRYLPHAKEHVKYTPMKQLTPMSTSALRIKFRDEEHWVGLNSVLRLYLEDRAYWVQYANKRIPTGFPMRLKEFRVGTYQGTDRAASYESQVDVPGMGEIVISMNEPLKHNGFTFYQASFQKDESGKPVVSVLSVNRDPGRWIKYLGSLLIVLGSIVLFYFKRTKWLSKLRSAA